MEHQAAADDDVEAPDPLRAQVVGADLDALGARAEELLGDPKASPGPLAGHRGDDPRAGLARRDRPVPLLRAADVRGHDLRRAPPLELEGEEAVVRPDVQAPLAADVR